MLPHLQTVAGIYGIGWEARGDDIRAPFVGSVIPLQQLDKKLTSLCVRFASPALDMLATFGGSGDCACRRGTQTEALKKNSEADSTFFVSLVRRHLCHRDNRDIGQQDVCPCSKIDQMDFLPAISHSMADLMRTGSVQSLQNCV